MVPQPVESQPRIRLAGVARPAVRHAKAASHLVIAHRPPRLSASSRVQIRNRASPHRYAARTRQTCGSRRAERALLRRIQPRLPRRRLPRTGPRYGHDPDAGLGDLGARDAVLRPREAGKGFLRCPLAVPRWRLAGFAAADAVGCVALRPAAARGNRACAPRPAAADRVWGADHVFPHPERLPRAALRFLAARASVAHRAVRVADRDRRDAVPAAAAVRVLSAHHLLSRPGTRLQRVCRV